MSCKKAGDQMADLAAGVHFVFPAAVDGKQPSRRGLEFTQSPHYASSTFADEYFRPGSCYNLAFDRSPNAPVAMPANLTLRHRLYRGLQTAVNAALTPFLMLFMPPVSGFIGFFAIKMECSRWPRLSKPRATLGLFTELGAMGACCVSIQQDSRKTTPAALQLLPVLSALSSSLPLAGTVLRKSYSVHITLVRNTWLNSVSRIAWVNFQPL